MNQESFEKKLYIPRNIEGKPNTEALGVIREIDEKFKDNPAFVGVVPKGSVVHGYSNEKSDVDMLILYDSSKGGIVDGIRNKFALEFIDKNIHAMYSDVNPEDILRNFDHSNSDWIARLLADMTQMVTGDKIDFYRNLFAKKLNEIPSENQEKIKSRVLKLLMDKEKYSMEKATKRVPELEGKKEELIAARRKLWEDRFEQVWSKSSE